MLNKRPLNTQFYRFAADDTATGKNGPNGSHLKILVGPLTLVFFIIHCGLDNQNFMLGITVEVSFSYSGFQNS